MAWLRGEGGYPLTLACASLSYAGLESLWPVHMEVDYVRVYRELPRRTACRRNSRVMALSEDPSNIMIGCDPADMPTASYIDKYYAAYT